MAGGVHDRRHAWQRGVHDREHAWQRGLHDRGHTWQGVCMTGDMHGRGCA